MNAIFSVIIIVSLIMLTVISPSSILEVMSLGASEAVKLSMSLLVVYSVWLGVFELIESGAIGRFLAKRTKNLQNIYRLTCRLTF